MMFYNGFNLMIDIILVTITAVFVTIKVKRDNIANEYLRLDYEYNEGWKAGYAIRDKENCDCWLPKIGDNK